MICPAFWRSIRRSKGKFARYFKNFDKTLLVMLEDHWFRMVGSGKSTATSALHLFDRTTSICTELLDQIPHHHIVQKCLNATRPRIFYLTRYMLVLGHSAHSSHFRAFKEAADRLPLELVEMIAYEIMGGSPSVEVNHLMMEKATKQDSAKFGWAIFQDSRRAMAQKQVERYKANEAKLKIDRKYTRFLGFHLEWKEGASHSSDR